MTTRLSPVTVAAGQFTFNDDEAARLCGVNNFKFSSSDIIDIQLAIGTYLAGTIVSYCSSTPGEVLKILKKTEKHLCALYDIFLRFFNADGWAVHIPYIDGTSVSEFLRQTIERKEFADENFKYVDMHLNQYMAAGNVIDYEFEKNQNCGLDIGIVCDMVKFTLENVRGAIKNIDQSGGRPEDTNYSSLVKDLSKIFTLSTEKGLYSSEFRDFFDEVRKIISSRLNSMGLKTSSLSILSPDKENLFDRFQSALNEPANYPKWVTRSCKCNRTPIRWKTRWVAGMRWVRTEQPRVYRKMIDLGAGLIPIRKK